MALTLQDMIKGMKDKVAAGIVLQFARESMVFQKIPFMPIDSFTLKTWQLASVTDAVYRNIGEAYTETKDQFTEKNEGIYLLGGKIDIDRALKLPGQREIDVYTENLMLQSKRFKYGFMNTFVNGNRAVTPNTFDGIAVRVAAAGSDQTLDAATGGVPLDLAASSANRQRFLDLLQQAHFEIAEGMPSLLLTSKQGAWQVERVARREGLFAYVQDAFGRQVPSIYGVPIEWAGTKGDQTTQIITNTEDAGNGANDSTSFYFVRFGYPYVTGLQMHEPKRIFDDTTDDGVTHRVVFEWPVGLATMHNKAITRVKGVKAI